MPSAKTRKRPSQVHPAFERFALLMRSELGSLDSKFHARFAEARWPESLTVLEEYCLERFDTTVRYLDPFVASGRPEGIAEAERLLKAATAKTLAFLEEVLEAAPGVRDDVSTRMAVRLKARALGYLSQARLKQYDAQILRSTALQTVTPATVIRRKTLLRAHRRKHGMTVADFARHVGISDATIRGVVQEDRKRFGDQSRLELLQVLGVSIEDWYRR